jgi:hypothetical protein
MHSAIGYQRCLIDLDLVSEHLVDRRRGLIGATPIGFRT